VNSWRERKRGRRCYTPRLNTGGIKMVAFTPINNHLRKIYKTNSLQSG
jgi:hypothetical protein